MKKTPLDQNLSRRAFLQAAAIVTGTGLVSLSGCAPAAQLRYPENPFSLGVASGDPQADSVVLWTRLSLNPLGPTGAGLPDTPIDVTWELAHDEGFRSVVQQGRAPATPDWSRSAPTITAFTRAMPPVRWAAPKPCRDRRMMWGR